MTTRLTRTSLMTAAVVAVLSITSVLALTKVNNRQPIDPTLQISGGPAGAMFSGRITGLTNSGSDAGAANGISTAVGFTPAAESLSPNRACTAMNFAVQVDVAPGISRSRRFQLVINGDSSSLISCTISGPSSLTCNSGSATHLVPARATLAIIETTSGGAVAGTAAAFGWECNSNRDTPSVVATETPVVSTVTPTPVVTSTTESAVGSAAEVTECKRILQSGTVSWGGGQIWAAGNIDKLCNGTSNAFNTISCFKANVETMGWSAAIDRCK